ncbi:hypothetical protein B0H16DRAFT_1452435 [Mycena metata]|uniref:Uncharacterized protein n=1 Tax=Mycena metata TaxID=1033252 RepID=A0AAD7NQD2_9AGAR|nr:hypothetical protein B0H16DRAFT_1452435 [Mycena metata]
MAYGETALSDGDNDYGVQDVDGRHLHSSAASTLLGSAAGSGWASDAPPHSRLQRDHCNRPIQAGSVNARHGGPPTLTPRCTTVDSLSAVDTLRLFHLHQSLSSVYSVHLLSRHSPLPLFDAILPRLAHGLGTTRVCAVRTATGKGSGSGSGIGGEVEVAALPHAGDVFHSALSSRSYNNREGGGETQTLRALIGRQEPARAALLRLARASPSFEPTRTEENLTHALRDAVLFLEVSVVVGKVEILTRHTVHDFLLLLRTLPFFVLLFLSPSSWFPHPAHRATVSALPDRYPRLALAEVDDNNDDDERGFLFIPSFNLPLPHIRARGQGRGKTPDNDPLKRCTHFPLRRTDLQPHDSRLTTHDGLPPPRLGVLLLIHPHPDPRAPPPQPPPPRPPYASRPGRPPAQPPRSRPEGAGRRAVVAQNKHQRGRRTTKKVESVSSASATSLVVPSPIQLPRLPFPISGQAGQVAFDPKEEETKREVVLTPAQERKRRRCLQELSQGSGVFVAFADEGGEGDIDEGERKKEEDAFDAIIRLSASTASVASTSPSTDETSHTNTRPILVLHAPSSSSSDADAAPVQDDVGVPRLSAAQLRAAVAFVASIPHRTSSSPHSPSSPQDDATGRRRILITAPPALAVEAFAAGICVVLSLSLSSFSLGAPPAAGEMHGGGDGGEDKRVHALVMGWHDLPQPTASSFAFSESSEGDGVEGQGGQGQGGDGEPGLHDAWRGLLSREGMDYLAGVLSPSLPSTSTTTSPTSPTSPAPAPDLAELELARDLPRMQLHSPSSSVASVSARSEGGRGESPVEP